MSVEQLATHLNGWIRGEDEQLREWKRQLSQANTEEEREFLEFNIRCLVPRMSAHRDIGRVLSWGRGMNDSQTVFEFFGRYHARLHERSRESRRMWQLASTPEEKEWAGFNNLSLSVRMMVLRDVGRFMSGINPEDDGNPFDPGVIDF